MKHLTCWQDILLDEFTTKEDTLDNEQEPSNENMFGFNDVQFTWDYPSSVVAHDASDQRTFTLSIPGSVVFEQGCLTLITGPTGSGKTSVLMALLGEMHSTPTSSFSWYRLPRQHGVSYATQESWVLNDTIRVRHCFWPPSQQSNTLAGKHHLRLRL